MIRDIRRFGGPLICSMAPLRFWHHVTKANLLIPYWHLVSDVPPPHVTGLYEPRNRRQFIKDIDFFLKHYQPIGLEEFLGSLDGKGELPDRCVLFTFDDGLREIYDCIAPLLREKGIPAIFFLVSSAVDNQVLCYPQKKGLLIRALRSPTSSSLTDQTRRILTMAGIPGADPASRIHDVPYRKRQVLDDLGTLIGCDFKAYVREEQPYLTGDQVRRLMNWGFAIGAHSVDHAKYSELSLEEQVSQTVESVRAISGLSGQRCETFAFPYSDAGVSEEFYSRVLGSGILRASFGIGGIAAANPKRHWPRFSMENTPMSARRVLARQFALALVR